MLEFVCFNHKIRPASEARLPAASAAAFYGRGVFTTVAFSKGEPFLWEKHWRRLNKDAARVNLDLSEFGEAGVKESLTATAAANDLTNGRARLTFFDRSLSGVWESPGELKTAFLIVAGEKRRAARDLRLTISPYRINSRSPLVGVKSCNYLENLLALERAKSEGFDEAVRLNERGEIVSACTANLFWTKNGEIFTAPPAVGALAGTTRAFVLENLPVNEKRAKLPELNGADEIFLTSAGVGARRVASVGGIKYDKTTIFGLIEKIFSNVFEP